MMANRGALALSTPAHSAKELAATTASWTAEGPERLRRKGVGFDSRGATSIDMAQLGKAWEASDEAEIAFCGFIACTEFVTRDCGNRAR
jgi:hypothetical protein